MSERQSARQTRFEGLLHEHRKIVFKVAGIYARTVEDRHDLAQEIAAQLWRAFSSYDESRRFSTWMYRVALNVGISFLRKEQSHALPLARFDEAFADREPAADEPANESADEPDERLVELHAFIAQLDALNRALILLVLEDRSYAEIAEILGISQTNVATKISRIKHQLRLRMTGMSPNTLQGARNHGTR